MLGQTMGCSAPPWCSQAPRFSCWIARITGSRRSASTFHGRDIFAPVAAHLAHGVPLEEMGTLERPERSALPYGNRSVLPADLIEGEVAYVDHFGNLITNIPGDWLADGQWRCEVHGHTIHRLSTTYAEVPPGALLALVSSAGTLEVAQRSGSAAQQLGVAAGEPVTLRLAA